MAMFLSFTILDVFTETPFQGSPLAVVTIPQGVNLTQHQKQFVARELNLSVTVFVHDVNDTSFKMRKIEMFTPEAELPFAGHPIIGTAAFLRPSGITTLGSKAGPLWIESTADGMMRTLIPTSVRLHENRLSGPEDDTESAFLTDVEMSETAAPIFSIVKGVTCALIELPSLQMLGSVKAGSMPDIPPETLDERWRQEWVSRRYYFVRQGTETAGGRTLQKIQSRLIQQETEQVATGGAACCLASYLILHDMDEGSATFEITEGVEIGRQCSIFVDVEVRYGSDGSRHIGTLHLGGKAVPVASGSLTLPP